MSQITPTNLKDLALSLCPELLDIISANSTISNSTWASSLETGKAIEFVTVCALAHSIRTIYKTDIIIPEIYKVHPELFYLRNVIPRHHGAQPGHSAAINSIPLKDRFAAALTPRLSFQIDGTRYGIYREGFPIHLISHVHSGGKEYLDRPDILIVEGDIKIHFPSSSELAFTFTGEKGRAVGALRIKNDAFIPLISFERETPELISVKGLVECSLGKEKTKARNQISKYLSLFLSKDDKKISTMMVNGKTQIDDGCDFTVSLDFQSDEITLSEALTAGSDAFIADVFRAT